MLTQDEYKLYTNCAVNFSDEDWDKLVSMSGVRLAGLLCLEELPLDKNGNLPANLALLLANFIYLILDGRGDNPQVEEKRVRNFTIRYATSNVANIFSKLQDDYGDIIASYSNCGLGFSVECDAPRCCDGCI